VEQDLADRVARGEYEVDAQAVAEAIIRRRPSFVLVAAQPTERAPALVEQDEPAAGDDLP
jgi:hypothetical protein